MGEGKQTRPVRAVLSNAEGSVRQSLLMTLNEGSSSPAWDRASLELSESLERQGRKPM